MAFINKTPSNLYFGRFKVKSGQAVPAVDYTEVELADIERFVAKGILANETAPVEEAPAEVEAVVAEEPAAEEVEETKEDQAEGKKSGKKK